ncbi:sigma-54-dependent transcriptional regulator [Haloferula chungangensis]|uniref:Sigma-54-dependent transcriptional regulator n=1 Tax=Haloferula chungangensis TaxID=1048331 RepID=A0ABW2L5K0_9BACT
MDILIVDDEESIRTSTRMAVEAEDHYAETADSLEVARKRLREEKFDLLFLDLRLGDDDGLELLKEIHQKNPHQLAVIFTAYASIETAVKATKAGAFDYLSKPFTTDQIRGILFKAQKALKTQGEIQNLENTVVELKSEVSRHSPPARFDSSDPMMQGALDTLFRAAKTPASILILGESGTGKSVIARSIHENSHLADKPFVTISCPSLSKELLESELFGHVKGAFTGAIKDKFGKVHAADGGTLFLDEIGELPIEIQPKLLRLLQEREYERLGENKTRKSNVRIIAATNRDLKKSVSAGEFREDLYYRINVISVELPPLRARKSDLMNFANDYLDYFSKQIGRNITGFSEKGLEFIQTYGWPGNLRELRNVIERATILCIGKTIDRKDLPTSEMLAPQEDDSGVVVPGADVTIDELESEHIKRVVERVENLQNAARILGIDKATLYRKRKKMNMT